MAEMWKPQPPEIILDWWESVVVEAQDQLNDWELRFISDIEMRVRNGIVEGRSLLSENQEKKLEQIYARYTK